MMSFRQQYEPLVALVTDFDVISSGTWQTVDAMLRQFPLTLQTLILPTETFSDK